MKVYLDVSCLNRPFDNQSQARIRLEAEATTMILEQCEHGSLQQISSEMAKDDRLCRLAKRRQAQLTVRVANPLDWLKEVGHDVDS